jgi:hypothetical protein
VISKADFQHFIDWLQTKPADDIYFYTVPSSCLIAQYLTACGLIGVSVGPGVVSFNTASGRHSIDLPRVLNSISQQTGTFGGALKIAKRKFREQFGQPRRRK